MKTIEINSLVLAYLGDTIYENYVRLYLIKKGINHVKELQEKSLNYVSAKSKSRILHDLINNNFFNDEELEILRTVHQRFEKESPEQISDTSHKEEAWNKYFNTDLPISFEMAFTLKAL